MRYYAVSQWLIFFFIYCFLGWIWECCYVSVRKHKWVNRGFLHGPFLPIYGSGAIVILISTIAVKDIVPLVFLLGMVSSTILEFCTGCCMEKLFGVRYWDYSNLPLNFKGHICFFISLAWGAFSILLVCVIHKPIEAAVLMIPRTIADIIALETEIIFFDEPTASLSERESQTLFKLIKELKEKGVCIVYISHRMEEVFELSDRITVFRNGKYIDPVNTKDVQEKDIISMMIGHELNIEKKSGSEFVNKNKVVLEVKNVQVFPGAKPVSFKLYEKEILGFFGLVGAGRTELARIIFGVDPIGSGEIYVEGGKVKISSPKDAIQAGIGLVPEDRKGLGLILGMSIKDNMLISKIGQFKSSLLNKKTLKNITGTFISDLGISLRNEEQEVKELSGGNQQKVVIAKWLAMEPNILIMDEPTRGIDIGAKSEIYALMRKMTEQGMSIIMISSEMAEVMQVSDRILVMHEGSISGELTAEEVTRNNIMQAAFGGVRE